MDKSVLKTVKAYLRAVANVEKRAVSLLNAPTSGARYEKARENLQSAMDEHAVHRDAVAAAISK
jgi:hypothetical protein